MDLNLSLKPEIAEKASKVIAIIKSKNKPIDIGKSFKKLIGQIKKKKYGKVSQELKSKVLEETVNLSKKFGEKVLEPITRPKDKGVAYEGLYGLGRKKGTVESESLLKERKEKISKPMKDYVPLESGEKKMQEELVRKHLGMIMGFSGTLTDVSQITPVMANALKNDTVNQLNRLGFKQEAVNLDTMDLSNSKSVTDLFNKIRATVGEIPLPESEAGSFLYEMLKLAKFIKK